MKSNTEGQKNLIEQDFLDAADYLKCDVAAIRAVDAVESGGKGFGPDGRPLILFEPHIFSKRTGHRFDKSHPHLSYPKWGTRPYPKTQAERYRQLEEAMKLNETAALESCSWGRFQVCGFNAKNCGYDTVQTFVAAMYADETNHLRAFIQYLEWAMLTDELREHRWVELARGYNGPQHFKHNYAGKLAAAHKRFGGR